MTTPRVPATGETAVEEARRIANHLLALLPADARDRLTAQAHAAGMRWLGSSVVVYDDDRAVTTRVAAELVSVPESTIRRWACTHHPEDPTRMLLPRHVRVGREMTYLVSAIKHAALVSEAGRRTRLASSRRLLVA